MLILDVFSETSSFGLETNRISSSDIDLKKIKTLKTLKEVPIFFPCRTENASITMQRTQLVQSIFHDQI